MRGVLSLPLTSLSSKLSGVVTFIFRPNVTSASTRQLDRRENWSYSCDLSHSSLELLIVSNNKLLLSSSNPNVFFC